VSQHLVWPWKMGARHHGNWNSQGTKNKGDKSLSIDLTSLPDCLIVQKIREDIGHNAPVKVSGSFVLLCRQQSNVA
jgi:hypothetical protein